MNGRADYQQLVYAGLGTHCTQTKLLPPAIIKPVPLWSGKQILSTIIINLTPKGKPLINIESGAKIGVKDWQNAAARPWRAGGTPLPNAQAMTESQVVIRHGQLLCGVLDKVKQAIIKVVTIISISSYSFCCFKACLIVRISWWAPFKVRLSIC